MRTPKKVSKVVDVGRTSIVPLFITVFLLTANGDKRKTLDSIIFVVGELNILQKVT